MSDAVATATAKATPEPATVSAFDIFIQFLIIGATSFGGGAVAYLRSSLVTKNKWLDDKSFLELFSISQSLPGLNTTNMAILSGDRMRGWPGAVAALTGVVLPGAILMTIAAILYGMHGERVLVTAGLKGVAAAASGLLLATFIQLARKTLRGWLDVLFIVIAVVVVNWFRISVLYALIGVATLATLAYRPRSSKPNVEHKAT
ncbi:MAG: chromate transporter [Candidatus Eremiobacteraeota bacterium]|nr:chromate transporter [Candidatus Eremiobacteraeota bacterium]MBV8595638.1 chromate transporter [Candidatus Eremiobacteraeota bacterium]